MSKENGNLSEYFKLRATSTPVNSVSEDMDCDPEFNTSNQSKNVSEPMDTDQEASMSNVDDFPSITEYSNEYNSSSEESGLTQNVNRRRIPNVGKDWNNFKPIEVSSLYYVVLNTPDSIHDMANRWLNLWEKDSKEGIIFMLQFFLDVAGYQNYKIYKIYNTKDFNEKVMLQTFRENCPKLLEDYTYLLRTNSEWSRSFKSSIYHFLQDLILVSDEKPRYNYSMLNDMFEFVKYMANSEIRAVKHTGVVFAIKFLISLSKLHKKYEDEMIKSRKDKKYFGGDFEIYKSYQNRASVLMKLMKDLFSNVTENCRYQDAEMEEMRQECLKGLYKMLSCTFEFYSKTIEIFKQCLVNPSNKTRLATVEIMKKIIENLRFRTHLKGKAIDIFRAVNASRNDIDLEVSAKTIDIFTASIKLYKVEIPRDIFNSIYIMVYNKYSTLGRAAGKFLYTMISNVQRDEDKKIKAILKFSKMPNVEHLLPLLVESLIDCAPELRSYDVILDLLLLDEEISSRDKVNLLGILCHTVMQVITGKSVMLRTDYREGVVDHDEVEIIMNTVLSKTEILFNRFSEDIICSKHLLHMLLSFSYNDQLTTEYSPIILNILELLSEYFFNTREIEILNMISELFSKICSVYCPIKMSGAVMLKKICKQCKDSYNIIAENENIWNVENIGLLETIVLQLQSLFKYHKISLNWNINKLRELFPKITALNEKLLSYNVSCSFEYEKSTFHTTLANILSNDNQKKEDFQHLKTKCDEFLTACYDYLRDAPSNIIMDKAYECLCDFSNEMAYEIHTKRDMYPQIMSLKIDLSTDHKLILLKFLKDHVFNIAVAESVGSKYFMKFNESIMKRGLPMCLVTNVFAYYNKFYINYGNLFDKILKDISLIDSNTLGIVVSTTLINVFKEIVNKEDISDNNRQYKELKKLALMFVRSLTAEQQVVTLRFAINFAFAVESNLIFLLCLDVFCSKIPTPSKTFILNHTKNLHNYNLHKGNKYVSHFTDFLLTDKRKRPGRLQGPARTRKAPSLSTTSSSSFAASEEMTGGEETNGSN